MTYLSDEELISLTESASIDAIKQYDQLSRSGLYNLPEYWITCGIASAFGERGLAVECEKRVDELLPEQKLGGRIDLAIYNLNERGNLGTPRALIEVKGPRTTWGSFPQAYLRLRMAAGALNAPGLLIGLVYGTDAKSAKQLDAEEKIMKRWFTSNVLGHERSDFLRVSQRQYLANKDVDAAAGANNL